MTTSFNVGEVILPKGIRFNDKVPGKTRIVDRKTGRWIQLRRTVKLAIRRAITVEIRHLGKDGVYHVHTVRRGLSGRQWKKYVRYRRSIGDPVSA